MNKRDISRFFVRETSVSMYDVVIHIGAPKTGSSAIQRFCSLKRAELESLGFYYPDHPLDKNGVSGGHTQVAGALINNKYEVAERRFHEWFKIARSKELTLLVSAEAFYGQHEKMAIICEGLKVQVIGFLRHPLDYMLGNHNQGIKRHMMTGRLNVTLAEMLSQPTPHLVGKPLCDWADQFGNQHCVFLPYSAPGQGKPLEFSFLNALGVSQRSAKRLVDQAPVTNRSYVKSALEVKRLLNTVLPELPETYAHQVDWCLQEYSDKTITEHPYQIHDIPKSLLEELSLHLLQQMEEVKIRFPELKEVTTIVDKNNKLPNKAPNLHGPLEAIYNEIPDILNEIRIQAGKLKINGRRDYAFLKLLDLLGIDFQEPQASYEALANNTLDILSSPNAQVADCLREMALMLERLGFNNEALVIIKIAHQRRPNGEGIKLIQKRLQKSLHQ